MTITFENVKEKYAQAVDCVEFNIQAALDDKAPQKGKSWYHHPTMVGWLHESSEEFARDCDNFSKKFLAESKLSKKSEEGIQTNALKGDIRALIREFRNKVDFRFYQDRKYDSVLNLILRRPK